MTKIERAAYLSKPALGYWSECGGVELKEVINDEYAIIVTNAWSGQKSVHKVKINYNSENVYVLVHGRHFDFSNCIRNGY